MNQFGTLLDVRLFLDRKHVKSHVMGEEIVEGTSAIENIENGSPLLNVFRIVAAFNFLAIQPVVFAPVRSSLKLLDKSIFHALLKLVNAVSSGEERNLKRTF